MLSKVYIRKYHVRALLGVAVALVNMAVQAEMITYTGPNGTNPGTLFMPETVQSGGTYLWSDHEGIHSGGDYCIGKNPCPGSSYYATSGWIQFVFAGKSLTINGGAALWWNMFGYDYTIDKLTIESGSKLTVDTRRNIEKSHAGTQYAYMDHWYFRGSTWKIDGELDVDVIGRGYVFDVAANLSGSGLLAFDGWQQSGYTSGTLNCDCWLSGDNSAFTGKFSFAHPFATDRVNTCALRVASEKNLGGACPHFSFDGVKISGFGGLHAADTFVFNTVNRGLYFDGAKGGTGYVEVDADRELTLATPVRIAAGGLRKLGDGTLALASVVTFGTDGTTAADGANSLVSVEAGFVRPLVSCANLDFVFAAGTGLKCDASVGGLVARSLRVDGEELPVDVDISKMALTPGQTYVLPVCTISAADATAVDGRIVPTVAGGSVAGTCVREMTGEKVTFSVSFVAPAKTVVVSRSGDDFVPADVSAVEVGSLALTLVNGGAELDVPVSEEMRYLVARLAADVRSLTADDIRLEGFAADNAGFVRAEIVGGAGAVREVYAVASPVIKYQGPSTGNQTFADAMYQGAYLWSDNLSPHGGGHYVIGKATAFYPAGSDKTLGYYTFPGASLTLVKDSGKAKWENYGQFFTLSNLTVAAGATLESCDRCTWAMQREDRQCFWGDSWRIDGVLQLNAVYYRQVINLYARLLGSGDVKFITWKNTNKYVGFYDSLIDADNRSFTGRIIYNLGEATTRDESMGLMVSRPEALGGAPATFLWDALSFGAYEGLHATDTFALSTPNRGISFSGSYFEVDGGKTLTVTEPIRVLANGFYKRGKGTLAFGASVTFGAEGTDAADGVNSAVTVCAGTFKPLVSCANLDLTLAAGTSLAFDAKSANATVAKAGLVTRSLVVQGDALPVTVDLGSFNLVFGKDLVVPLMTVPSNVAQALADKITAKTSGSRQRRGEVRVVDSDVDGYSLIEAVFTRKGMVLVVW